MPVHSRSKNGVASLACVAGTRVLNSEKEKDVVDGRNKSGHDERMVSGLIMLSASSRPSEPTGPA
jgi:hypothetical protein